jgi:hypothetical protein
MEGRKMAIPTFAHGRVLVAGTGQRAVDEAVPMMRPGVGGGVCCWRWRRHMPKKPSIHHV